MRRRSKAREYALQVLYQIELTHADLERCLEEFWKNSHGDGLDEEAVEIRRFTSELVRRIAGNLVEIDAEIEKSAEHWKMKRMALVDRNILRLGTCEILHFDDIPSKVAINEAIELAKRFGDAESPKFVNGILDKVAKTHNAL